MVNNLKDTRVYLMGPMENLDGSGWRKLVRLELGKMGIVSFDPYIRPFVNEVKEDEETRKNLRAMMEAQNFSFVASTMKKVRSDDLRMCDLSDFGIAQIEPTVPTFGTMEEISWFVRCKKPLFLFIGGGKIKTPLWLMGMVPHIFIFDSVEDILNELKQIDKGDIEMDFRWKLLKEEYR